jgi:hypothetical protein
MGSVQGLGRDQSLGGVRTAGLLCAAGGAGWLAVGAVSLVLIQPTGLGYAISQVFWIAVQAMLLVGVIGLAFSGAAPGWFGGVALVVAFVGRLDFVAAEIHSLVIGEESLLLPLGALITAVGMTLVGIAVLRARRWEGWQRFTPLLAGLYPFVAMFPLIAVRDEPSMIAITVWGLPWLLLGYALTSATTRER